MHHIQGCENADTENYEQRSEAECKVPGYVALTKVVRKLKQMKVKMMDQPKNQETVIQLLLN
jgi:hypothetical protein